MADPKPTESEALLRKYLEDAKIAIVDSSGSARTGLAALLVKFGANRSNMLLTGSFEEAQTEFKKMKPILIFSDYTIGRRSGLDLLQAQREAYVREPAILKQCIFILVTGNGSQSTVARAAEEDVDTFVLKPYTQNSLKNALEYAVQVKFRPGPYLVAIDRGKGLLEEGNPDAAIGVFEEAKKLDEKPTLACFYLAQAQLLKQLAENAGTTYREGLDFNKIHYRCLVGLYELLYRDKRYTEAYDVVKRIAQYFPANPKRLASVLRLAILTSQYEDIEGFYRIFTGLEDRHEELVRYICSAMAVTGKYYLRHGHKTRAMEVFERVSVTCAGRTGFLRYLVEALVEEGHGSDAAPFLSRFPLEGRQKEDYLVAEFLVKGSLEPALQVVGHGLKLISGGVENPVVYRLLTERAVDAGLWDKAGNFAYAAIGKWPDRADEFKEILRRAEAAKKKAPDGAPTSGTRRNASV